MSRPSAGSIRKGLAEAAAEREQAERMHRKATERMRRLLRHVPDTEGLTVTEAAQLAKVSRKSVYELIRE